MSQPKEKRENKCISRAKDRGGHLRKREKMNDKLWLKTGGGAGQPMEKSEKKMISSG